MEPRILQIVSLILLLHSTIVKAQYSQSVVLYPQTDIEGPSSSLIETYIGNLSTISWDNRAMSACIFGIWVFYDLPEYNPTDSYVEYAFGSWPYGFCFNLENMTGRTSSLSYVGAVDDYRLDRLTLFVGTNFQGKDQRISSDLPSLTLDRMTVSIIVTGGSTWTLYEGLNYTGNRVCVSPPNSTDFSPAFITDTRIIGLERGTVRSVQKGCFGGREVVVNEIPSHGKIIRKNNS